MTARIATLLLLVVMAAFVAAVPATAGGPDAGSTVVAQEEPDGGPAVTRPPLVEPDEVDPWTTRFLVPTGLALTGVVLVVLAVAWGWKRSRYRVIE